MTDPNISALRDEIRRLNTTISDLSRANASSDRRLDSLDNRIRGFWLGLWLPMPVFLPLATEIFATIFKHW